MADNKSLDNKVPGGSSKYRFTNTKLMKYETEILIIKVRLYLYAVVI